MDREGAKVPDGSIDVVYADIVYGSDTMAGGVARLAARVLVTGGVLILIGGGDNCREMLNAAAEHLTLVTIGGLYLTGMTQVRPGPVQTRDQLPIFFFSKGRLARPIRHVGFRSEASEGEHQPRDKNTEATLAMLQAVVDSGANVLDPCAGGGIAGEAALRHGCRFIGIDCDPDVVRAARARLAGLESQEARHAG